MKCMTNIPTIVQDGGGLTPCTVTINKGSDLSGETLYTNIFYWYDGSAQRINGATNYPITFQTYVNSGFAILGEGNIWENLGFQEESQIGFDYVYANEYRSIFYVIPTSPNCSLTLIYI